MSGPNLDDDDDVVVKFPPLEPLPFRTAEGEEIERLQSELAQKQRQIDAIVAMGYDWVWLRETDQEGNQVGGWCMRNHTGGTEMTDGTNDKKRCCSYCNKEIDNLAGNPCQWGVSLPLDRSQPGKPVMVCRECVVEKIHKGEEKMTTPILDEINRRLERLEAAMADTKTPEAAEVPFYEAGGVPFYNEGDVPSPYIPFVVKYRIKRWTGVWVRRSKFVECTNAHGAVRAVLTDEPKARIDLVASVKYDRRFPDLPEIWR